MAVPPPPRPPTHFGIPEEAIEIAYHFHIYPYLERLEYVLVESTVWVDVGQDALRPHEFRSWYRHYYDGQKEGPILKSDVPRFVLEEAFGEGTADYWDGSIVDANNPREEDNARTLVYLIDDDNWNEEEGEIVEQEEWQEDEPMEEEPMDELADEPEDEPGDEELEGEEDEEEEEDDLEENFEYNPDED